MDEYKWSYAHVGTNGRAVIVDHDGFTVAVINSHIEAAKLVREHNRMVERAAIDAAHGERK